MADVTSFLSVILIIFILWFPQAVYQAVTWTYWLQVKEYRFDRFGVFLKTIDGKQSLGLNNILIKLLAIIFTNISIWIPVFFFIYLDFLLLSDILNKKVRKPRVTDRIKRIWLTVFLGLCATFSLSYYFLINSLLIGEILMILTPLFGILWTQPLVNRAKEKEKQNTIKLLNEYKTYVIGITGSYGKTTTKDILTQLLSTKYSVLSTYKNQNTYFGILRRINTELKKDHKFLITEVGAYKKGEIKEIAEILKPKTVFITGIEPQHLELFGNIEDLKSAKFELIESLQKEGKAFFNLSKKGVNDLLNKAKILNKDIDLYTYAVGKMGEYDASSEIVEVTTKGILFRIFTQGVSKEIRTNILSKKLIENLTGAILAARILGVDWGTISKACENLSLPEGTLNVYQTKTGVTIIDDSYNSSPSGFEAALELLGLFEGKKRYVITTGIIELGDETEGIHKKLAGIMEKRADCILLRNKAFEWSIRSGLKNKNKLILMTDLKKMLTYLNNNLKRNDIVLIEGKLPKIVDYFRLNDEKR